MHKLHFETIETPRLLLKGLSPEIMTVIFENYSKAEIKKILGHQSDEAFEKEADKQKKGYATYNRSFMVFLLVDKGSQNIIGRCGIHNWNAEHRRAEVGYVMEDETYKRKGLMTEALGAIIDYGFTVLNLHRIEALVSPKNSASLRLMEKFNFVQEGVLREHYFVNGVHEDSVMFSKLHEER